MPRDDSDNSAVPGADNETRSTPGGGDDGNSTLPVSALERVDQACKDFEAAWRRGERPRIEDYLRDARSQERAHLLRELILLELDYRHKNGERPNQGEYEGRFPEDRELIRVIDFSAPESIPERIGQYTILEELGRGGMGVVYLAEQRKPIRRRVALKCMTRTDHREFLARFESERQALALMNHPNIARVHDAGATEDGQPFFAMEHVQGVPIDEYCDQHRLSITERLRLFVQVCQGIEHAHHRGVIHRDIKPSNILVSAPDEEPVAKIIDFGVAKATNQRLTERTLYTEVGRVIGTPQYMSPEQAKTTGEDVDHRTDIYSLGVLLYELLVGELPLELDVRSVAFDEIVRRIREEDPPTPSTRWSRLNLERTTKLASKRDTNPGEVGSQLRQDLDWICMKALDKERNRRYSTASELAGEIQRYLKHEPVLASPPSALYRVRKFVRKNRRAVVAVVAVFLALAVGLVLSSILYVEAERNYNLAEEGRVATRRAEEETRWQAYLANIIAADLSLEAGNHGEARRRLDACSKELRGWEWYHYNLRRDPSLVTATFLSIEEGHCYVSFCLDGKRVVSGVHDYPTRHVRLWDAESGDVVATIEGMFSVYCVSHYGKHMVSVSMDDVLHLWELETAKVVATLRGHRRPESAAISADGKRVAFSDGLGPVYVWDTEGGEVIAKLPGRKDNSYEVAISADGKWVAAASSGFFDDSTPDDTLRVWKTGTAELTRFGLDASVSCLAFSPDGKRIAAGFPHDPGILVWTTESAKRVVELRPERGRETAADEETTCVAFSPDGQRIVSGGPDKTIRLWDVDSGQLIGALSGHEAPVTSVAFSPDGRRIASGSPRELRIWDSETAGVVGSLSGGRRFFESVAFTSDGSHILSSGAGVWDAETGEVVTTTGGHFSPDGRRVAHAEGQNIRVSDVQSGELVATLKGHRGEVTSVTFCPTGERIASVSRDDTVAVWNLDPAKVVAVLAAKPPVALSTDGKRVASGSFWDVQVWDVETAQIVANLHGQAHVGCVAFSPDGKRVASGSNDGTLRLWDLQSEKVVAVLRHDAPVDLVAFSPCGNRMISLSSGVIWLWDAKRGDSLTTLRHKDRVDSVAFSPDAKRIVSSSGTTLQLWESELASARKLWHASALRRRVKPLVDRLFQEQILADRVIEELKVEPSLDAPLREIAVNMARVRGDLPAYDLDYASWKVVSRPDATEREYALALKQAKVACQLEPKDAGHLNTLGVAQYRVGQFEGALATLTSADTIRKQSKRPHNREIDLVFISMCRYRLGQTGEAKKILAEARRLAPEEPDEELRGFLREADALIGE